LEHYDYKISIETNGSFEIPFPIIEMCGIVMDFKLDAKDRMLPLHFLMLKRTDFVKFLIRDQQQMDVAIEIIKTLRKDGLQAQVAFSPILPFGPDLDRAYLLSEIESKSEIIIEGIRKMGNEGILNLQLHKLIGVE
jgi:organic radical activating enzyme